MMNIDDDEYYLMMNITSGCHSLIILHHIENVLIQKLLLFHLLILVRQQHT